MSLPNITVMPSYLPERLRLAPGRATVWRSPSCLQLGLDPQRAMVLDGLPEPLAALLNRMDGVRSTAELIATAETAGSPAGDAFAMLTDLHRSGLVQDASAADDGPPGWHRVALATEATSWSVHTTCATRRVLRQRREAAVRVVGSGRIAVALATLLAAAGVGQVAVEATGTVTAADVGTGYLPDDIGRTRAAAAADAVRRCAPEATVSLRRQPDLVVLCDVTVPEPVMVTELLTAGISHLIGYAHEGTAVVGPLVCPGRSSCLHCAELHLADSDLAWPKLAAQLAGQVQTAGLACTQLAAALTAEQILAALAGPRAGLPVPPTWCAALEVDPVRGTLRRHPRPVHPRCGCGAR
ncbi:MAG TPA: ThiF family adenylyltransferase [Pseudonocardiaceae bacterium]|nr:ThiF family adenylyltransferase [Pseudonocardiaceae bacterium]